MRELITYGKRVTIQGIIKKFKKRQGYKLINASLGCFSVNERNQMVRT